MNKLITLTKNKPMLSTLLLILTTDYITNIPLQDYLCNIMPYQAALMLSIIIVQMGTFGLCIYIARKLGFNNMLNMNLSTPIKSIWITLPFLLLIILNVFENMKLEFITNKPLIFILYFFAFLSTGFFEEILFRGIGFNLINSKFGITNKGFYCSLFISNFIFGFSHITHVLEGTMPLMNFLNQMIYATIVGIFFTALYLRCNSLWIPILLHGLFDVGGAANYLNITSPELFLASLIEAPMSCMEFINNTIIFIPFLFWGLFLLRKAAPNYKREIKVEKAPIIESNL